MKAMNKRVKRNLASFQQAQRHSARYHISQYTPHEQAIREHITRGFEQGLYHSRPVRSAE